MKKYLLLFPLILLIWNNSFAQTTPADSSNVAQDDSTQNTAAATDVDNRRIDSDVFKDWGYSLGLDGDFKTGNLKRTLLNIRATFDNDKGKRYIGFHTSPRFSWGTLNETLAEREIFLDLNITLGFHQHDIYGLIFGIFEQSNLRKIATRLYAGTGVGWRIVGGKATPSTHFKLVFTTALLHENTDYTIKDDISVWRISNRIKITYEIIPQKLTFHNYTFFQPAINADYFRWNAISQLAYAVSKRVNFMLNYENSYESFVVPGAVNTDTHLTFGVSFKSQ